MPGAGEGCVGARKTSGTRAAGGQKQTCIYNGALNRCFLSRSDIPSRVRRDGKKPTLATIKKRT